MSTSKFAKTYNLVAFLEKSTESKGFEQIIDFLNANPIKYALTVNPMIYTSCIKQIRATINLKTINEEEQIQALVDKKKVIITKTSVRSDLHLEDAEDGKNLEGGVEFLMFLRFVQVFLDTQVEGMLKHKEIYVTPSHTKKIFANMKRQGKDFSGMVTPLFDTMMVQPQEDMDEYVTTTSNDPLVSGEDRLKLTEFMELYTHLQLIVLDLETTKANQALEIKSLKRRVKKLKKKGRMIKDLDDDEGVALVDETQGRNDRGIFDTSILDDEEVVAEKEVSTADPVPTAGEVLTTGGVEPSETPTQTPIDSSQQSSKDKNKELVKGSEKAVEGSSKSAAGKVEQEDAKRLQVDYEVEMAYDLFRWIRRQISKGYVPE
nr:hypothetical protein [Tanacetum cinerariifolium]